MPASHRLEGALSSVHPEYVDQKQYRECGEDDRDIAEDYVDLVFQFLLQLGNQCFLLGDEFAPGFTGLLHLRHEIP